MLRINFPFSRKVPRIALLAFGEAPLQETMIATPLNAFKYKYLSVVYISFCVICLA